MRLNSQESIKLGKSARERYGSWEAVREASRNRSTIVEGSQRDRPINNSDTNQNRRT